MTELVKFLLSRAEYSAQDSFDLFTKAMEHSHGNETLWETIHETIYQSHDAIQTALETLMNTLG